MTIGERIAADFSRDKRHLTDAEQRRLAAMIDARFEAAIDNYDDDGFLTAIGKFDDEVDLSELEGEYDAWMWKYREV